MDFMLKIIIGFAGIVLLFLVFTLGMVVIEKINPPPTYSLNKTDWKCTKTIQRKTVRTQVIGKGVIAIPTIVTECVQYEKMDK